MLRSFFFILLIHNLALAQPLQRFQFSRGLFGTQFNLTFYAPDNLTALRARDAVYARMDSLNVVMSDYLDGSEINRLSATAGSGRWIPVSPDLYEVLEKSLTIARLSDGRFDPTIGPLSVMWRRAVRRKQFPSRKEVRKAHQFVNYRWLKLDPTNRTARLKRSGMRLDLGGIGQGFAIDKGLAVLQSLGIRSALLDIGGDILAGEAPAGQTGWRVLVGTGADTLTMYLKNRAITTSGATYRYLEHRGKRYSHLLNPRTGIGLRHHVQTTVLAPDGVRADALTKVFAIAGERKRKRLLKRFPGVEVL